MLLYRISKQQIGRQINIAEIPRKTNITLKISFTQHNISVLHYGLLLNKLYSKPHSLLEGKAYRQGCALLMRPAEEARYRSADFLKQPTKKLQTHNSKYYPVKIIN